MARTDKAPMMTGAFFLVVLPKISSGRLRPSASSRRICEKFPKFLLCQSQPAGANIADPASQLVQALAVVEELSGESASFDTQRRLGVIATAQKGVDGVHPQTIGAHPVDVNPDMPRLFARGTIGDDPDMISTDRIEERMAALNLNPFSAAKKAGLGQDYVRDILRGKVKEPSASKLRSLAAALDCSAEYLQGVGEEPGERPVAWSAMENLHVARLVVEQEIRDGFHRNHKPKKEQSFPVVSYSYGGASEWLELVRDPQLDSEITSGTFLHAVGVDQYFDGLTDIVIYEQSMEQGDLVARRVGRLSFSSKGMRVIGDGDWWSPSDAYSWDELKSGRNKPRKKVVGLVIRAYQFFSGDFNSDEMGF